MNVHDKVDIVFEAEYQRDEQRLNSRHAAAIKVFVKTRQGGRKSCTTINVSTSGAAIVTQDIPFMTNEMVELVFITNRNNIRRLHYRVGKVRHLNDGVTGFSIKSYYSLR